jgi:hypothetical protein
MNTIVLATNSQNLMNPYFLTEIPTSYNDSRERV